MRPMEFYQFDTFEIVLQIASIVYFFIFGQRIGLISLLDHTTVATIFILSIYYVLEIFELLLICQFYNFNLITSWFQFSFFGQMFTIVFMLNAINNNDLFILTRFFLINHVNVQYVIKH